MATSLRTAVSAATHAVSAATRCTNARSAAGAAVVASLALPSGVSRVVSDLTPSMKPRSGRGKSEVPPGGDSGSPYGAALGAAYTLATSVALIGATYYLAAPSPREKKSDTFFDRVSTVVETQSETNPKDDHTPRDCLVIVGGNADTSKQLILDALKENPNRNIIVFVRNKPDELTSEMEERIRDRVTYVVLPKDDDYKNEEKIKTIVTTELGKCKYPIRTLSMICCAGGAIPEYRRDPKTGGLEDLESSLRYPNYYPLISTTKAILAFAKENEERKGIESVYIVNVSSVAPSIIGDEVAYSKVKGEADAEMLRLVEEFGPSAKGYSLRLGMVMDGSRLAGSPYDTGLEIFGRYFDIHIGSGGFMVPMTSSRNVTTALRKMIEGRGGESGIIDAADPEGLDTTMKAAHDFFNELLKRKGRTSNVYIPMDVAIAATKLASFARMCHYATLLAKKRETEGGTLDTSRFEELVGTEFYDWRDSFDEKSKFASFPIREYIRNFITQTLVKPGEACELVGTVLAYSPELVISIVAAGLGIDNPDIVAECTRDLPTDRKIDPFSGMALDSGEAVTVAKAPTAGAVSLPALA